MLYRSAVAAAAAAVLLSCRQEEMPLRQPDGIAIEFSSSYPDFSDATRTHWDGETIMWSESDKMAACYTKDGVWSDLFASDELAQSGATAEFSADTDLETGTAGTFVFYGIYPYACVEGGFADAPEVNVRIPQTQTPTASSFDPSADMMAAESTESYTSLPEGHVPLLWHRLVAHLDMTLTGLSAITSDENLVSVTLDAGSGASLTGLYTMELTERTLEASSSDAVSGTVVLNAENLAVSSGSLRVWAAFAPCTMTSLKITVRTDAAVYVRSMSSLDLAFTANRRHVLSVDMTDAERITLTSAEDNAKINSRLFEVLDLDHVGLEKVKEEYTKGNLYYAATLLKEYYASRTGVTNPFVDLTITSNSDADKTKADNALAENGYRFFISGYDYYSFLGTDGGINWDYAPVTETQFALQKHRHQWMESQAKVYRVTKDEKYVKSIVEVYSDWLETYPCPVAGESSYKISSSAPLYDMWTDLQATSRIMSCLNVLEYCIGSENFTPEFLSDFLVAMHDCVECIRANEYYKETSNHRLYEVQAVYTAAVLLPELAGAETWLAESVTDVSAQISAQFASDGVQNEMDPSYHIAVLGIFYEIDKVASENSLLSRFPSGYTASLSASADFVCDMMYPDYSLENFNDTRAVSWTKSVLKKNFSRYVEMFPDEGRYRWMATEGTEGTAPTGTYSEYTASGWYMMRTGWTEDDMMLILKNNRNEDGWWHCQPDNGTVSLYRDGRHFLPDAGVYTYGGSTADDALRDSYRSTAMHNTLMLDGATIADGNMLGTYVASAQNEAYDAVYVKNQSYPALRHERTVYHVKEGGFFVVVDFGIGSAVGNVQLSWHLCPGDVTFAKHTDSYSCSTAFGDGNDMTFRTFCFNGKTPTTDFTATDGTSCTSSAIGVSEERSYGRISVNKSTADTPVGFITVIHPFKTSAPEIGVTLNSYVSYTVNIDGKTYDLSRPE